MSKSTKEKLEKLLTETASGNEVDGGALCKILQEVIESSIPLEVEDIEALTGEQLDALEVGDKVVKITGKQKHLYLVTYKGEGVGEGLVLTYNACGYGEAIAYDLKATGWEFTDKVVKTYGE